MRACKSIHGVGFAGPFRTPGNIWAPSGQTLVPNCVKRQRKAVKHQRNELKRAEYPNMSRVLTWISRGVSRVDCASFRRNSTCDRRGRETLRNGRLHDPPPFFGSAPVHGAHLLDQDADDLDQVMPLERGEDCDRATATAVSGGMAARNTGGVAAARRTADNGELSLRSWRCFSWRLAATWRWLAVDMALSGGKERRWLAAEKALAGGKKKRWLAAKKKVGWR